MPTEPCLLGIDLGTSAVKVALFTPQGDVLGRDAYEYFLMPTEERVEADPDHFWQLVVSAIRRLLAGWGGRPEQIAAISTSTFGESVFCLGADGRPTRPCLMWMDSRSQAQAEAMLAELGSQAVLEVSGQPDIWSIWPATKIRWLAEHEPDVLARTTRILLPTDYLLFRLTGEYVAEHTGWSSSLLVDIRQKAWSPRLLAWAGIDSSQLPPLVAPGTVIGVLGRACAEETGLHAGTPVVAGAMDQVSAAVAAGNIAPGVITESTGTVLSLLATVHRPIFDAASKVPCHIHAAPGQYCMQPWSTAGGIDLKWFKDRFGQVEQQQAAQDGSDVYDVLTAEAAHIPPGSEGLLMLPHLDGAVFPEFNPAARAVFFGMRLKHTREHFVRAILEAVAYMIRRDLEALAGLGVAVTEIRALGGGARSRLWCQIKADVCGLPVIIPADREASVLGAAMIAAVGVGLYPDLPGAVRAMSRPGTYLLPNAKAHARYDEGYRLYVTLYDRVKDLFVET